MRTNLQRLFCSLVFFCIFIVTNHAQTASTYVFSQSTNAYTALTSPTSISFGSTTTTWDDNVQPVLFSSVSPAFAFSYNNVAQTSVSVNSNGFVTFGSTASTTTGYSAISSTTAYNGAIAAFGRDLINNSQTIKWGVEGASPNRIFVIQWDQARRYSAGGIAGDNLNFQIRLSETTNVIEIRYGSCVATNTTSYTGQVGLRGAAATDFNNRSSTTSWAATLLGTANTATVTTLNTIMPASGLTFRYTPAVPCTGAPAPGNTIASATSGCVGYTPTLSLQNVVPGLGITYQWQSSTDNVTFANVAGTASTFTAPAVISATPLYYRCGVTCSGTTTFSTSVSVSASPNVYASLGTLPYVESFETWSNYCNTTDIPGTGNNWLNTPSTGNNSWRRDDQGTNAVWTSPTSYIYSPVFTTGARSARFHSGNSTSGLQGKLDFYVNASAYTSLGLTFDYINTSGTDVLQVLLSTDGGATFTAVGASVGVAAAWTNIARTLPVANSATCVIRLQATSDFGSTDIGVDNFSLDNLCTGTPTAGNSASTLSTLCNGGTTTLSSIQLQY